MSVEASAATVARIEFSSYERSIPEALDAIDASRAIQGQKLVLLKPNLVTAAPHPVTTHPAMVAAMIDAIAARSSAEIIVAEGTGAAGRETADIFSELGYDDMARLKGVKLVDLNHEPLRALRDPSRPVFPEMHLPEIILDCFVISLPVLKVHSLAGVTGAIKNMMGAAPPQYYGSGGGGWKKSRFHTRMQASVRDLAFYRMPDMAVMDASQGMRDYHLGGPTLSPPPNLILASRNALALDRESCALLGVKWRDIGHLAPMNELYEPRGGEE